MNHQRISLPEHMYPVESYFNWISSANFLSALENFANGRGFNIENNTCSFPSDIAEDKDEDEASIRYIEFWTYSGNADVRVSFGEFEGILRKVAQAEIERQPQKAQLIDALLERVISWLSRR